MTIVNLKFIMSNCNNTFCIKTMNRLNNNEKNINIKLLIREYYLLLTTATQPKAGILSLMALR